MTIRYFLIAVLAAICPGAFAGTISGVIRDADKGVPFANVLLLRSSDSSLVKTEVCAEDGRYSIEVSAAGSYLVKVKAQGYEAAYSPVLAYTSEDIKVPDIQLTRMQKALHEVTIRGQKPLIEVKADKLVMNVEASITNTGSTAFEILQRAPGVSVDQNENISLKGKQGLTIMIDGKLVPVRGEDLANLLKGTPSGIIDQIEIISNPGARYDAAGTAGIINIRMRKDKRIGTNGSINGGYGQGVYPKANAGLSLNYRGKKLSLYGNYNGLYRKNINNLDLMRRFYTNGEYSSAFDQHDEMLFNFKSHSATVGADYNLSSRTSIGTVVTGGQSGFDLKGNNGTVVLNAQEAPSSSFYTKRDNVNAWSNWGMNLNMHHRLDSAGSELSVDADYARYANSSDQSLLTTYHYMDGTQQYPDALLYGTLSGNTDIRSLKADYTKQLPKKGLRLEAGIKSSLVQADNNPQFYDRSGGGNVYDSGKSNHFIYDENINAAYINAAKDWKLWSVQVGLRGEQTIAKGHQLVNDDKFDRSYGQLFPSLAATRHINAKNDLGITLSRRIERPNYQQLNPFRRYLDVSSVNQGNPYLQPALTWSTELTHTWKGKFITQLSYSRTTDAIVQVIQPESGTLTIVTDKNLATNTVYNFSGTYPLQPLKWWNATVNFNLFYSQYEGNLAQTPLTESMPTFNLYAQNSFMMPRDWSAELTGWYQSEQLYGYMHINPQFVLSVGLQKQLWDKKATVKLSITDLLLQQNPIGRSDYYSYHETFIVHRDSRVATLTASYRFGKRTVAPTRKRQRGAEDELRRAGGGNGAS
jgi:hypothetical protein